MSPAKAHDGTPGPKGSGVSASGRLAGRGISVVGGGIAGLAAARALALRGACVTLWEQAEAITEVGAGLQISPNGVAVLDALGLGQEARQAAVRSRAVVLADGFTGAPVLRLDLARHAADQTFLLFHRADLVGLLERGARAAGVDIRLGERLVSVGADGEGLRFESGATAGGFVLGADGLHSLVRVALNGPQSPFFTGQVAWRALVPMEEPPAPEAWVHMGPGHHLVAYPLRGGSLMNIVAVEERAEWAEEGWHHRADPAGLRRAFSSFSPGLRQALERVDEVHLWGLFRHEIAPTWQRPGMAVIGDAAHPTLPFLAQGANMALEDAWLLAARLDQMDEVQALARWQAERAPRVARAIAAANENARNYHLGGLARYAAFKALRLGGQLAPRAALHRFDWLYRHDVTRA